MLQKTFTRDEIKSALFNMAPFKAPGKDSLHVRFFQKSWDVVGDSLCEFALTFFASGTLLEGMNDTSLVLIPKVKHPESPSQFRPISLCNVGYKVITKTLTNRLKELTSDDRCESC